MKLEVKEIKPVAPPKEYILTLNQNELDLIHLILSRTGRYDGSEGWRNCVDEIYTKTMNYATIRNSGFVFDERGYIKSNPDFKPK